ncbi:hypothetical protein [Niallia circulans]|uniref:hypothetical protein n=1 Tax=Niallia circulans TaxID=1397 RepID=UPI001561955F|nr:hypothetical protein [Niallia circulans]NRG33922.1 hypothetical protein [Niallia circulans]
MTNEKQPQFNFGDLVRVAGYWPQVFVVDGRRKEHYEYPDEEWTEMVYELHGAFTLEWLEADVEDLTLVAPAANAEEYLNGIGQPTIDLTDYMSPLTERESEIIEREFNRGMEEMRMLYGKQPKEPRKPTARELSAQEAERRKAARKERADQIDNLLDIANWNRKKFAETGEQEYAAKIAEVEAELKKITEGAGE